MEMVERVARSLCSADIGGNGTPFSDDEAPAWWRRYRYRYMKLAECAVRNMREPTVEMAQAGETLAANGGDPNEVWSEMVGVALGRMPNTGGGDAKKAD